MRGTTAPALGSDYRYPASIRVQCSEYFLIVSPIRHRQCLPPKRSADRSGAAGNSARAASIPRCTSAILAKTTRLYGLPVGRALHADLSQDTVFARKELRCVCLSYCLEDCAGHLPSRRSALADVNSRSSATRILLYGKQLVRLLYLPVVPCGTCSSSASIVGRRGVCRAHCCALVISPAGHCWSLRDKTATCLDTGHRLALSK